MKKTLLIDVFLLLCILILISLIVVARMRAQENVQSPSKTTTTDVAESIPKTDPRNIAYTVDGETFTVVNGRFERPVAPGASSMRSLSLFGEPVYGDLDADGDEDAAILLSYSSGGSGVFYYAVLALNTAGIYTSTNVLLLGDRIAPQTVEIHDGRAVYNYAIRRADEPMTTPPSIGKSLWVHLDSSSGTIGEWVKDFEGEADPTIMRLNMKQWTWLRTEFTDGTSFTPKRADAFTITFGDDNGFSATTDCNSMGGRYTGTRDTLTLSEILSTLMYCDGSEESEFSRMLSEVERYHFTSKGELVFELKNNVGSAYFR